MRLGLPLRILNVDAGISRSWRLEDHVAGTRLPRRTEVLLANLPEIGKPDIGRFAPHLIKKFSGRSHLVMDGTNSDTTEQARLSGICTFGVATFYRLMFIGTRFHNYLYGFFSKATGSRHSYVNRSKCLICMIIFYTAAKNVGMI